MQHHSGAPPPGPVGACHRAGQRPDPVGRPDDRLRVPAKPPPYPPPLAGEGREGVGTARRARLCPPYPLLSNVARIEPPGPAFGRPDDKLREIRGPTIHRAIPLPAPL